MGVTRVTDRPQNPVKDGDRKGDVVRTSRKHWVGAQEPEGRGPEADELMPSSLGGNLKLGWSRGGQCSGEEKEVTSIGGFGGEQLLRGDLREVTSQPGWVE